MLSCSTKFLAIAIASLVRGRQVAEMAGTCRKSVRVKTLSFKAELNAKAAHHIIEGHSHEGVGCAPRNSSRDPLVQSGEPSSAPRNSSRDPLVRSGALSCKTGGEEQSEAGGKERNVFRGKGTSDGTSGCGRRTSLRARTQTTTQVSSGSSNVADRQGRRESLKRKHAKGEADAAPSPKKTRTRDDRDAGKTLSRLKKSKVTRLSEKFGLVDDAEKTGQAEEASSWQDSTKIFREVKNTGLVAHSMQSAGDELGGDSDCELSRPSFPCCAEGVCTLYPGRQEQMHQLAGLLMGEQLPPNLFVHGYRSCGKTLVLATLLPCLQLHYAIVDCRECYCPEVLFMDILHQLSNHTPITTKCHTMPKFLSCFKQLACMKACQPVCIVLDNSDHFEDDAQFLTTFEHLAELCNSSMVCVVFVSTEDYLECDTPADVYFPAYSRENTLEILAMDCPAHQPLPFFRTFVQHILSVFQSVCLDVSELRSLCCSLFPRYAQPVERGEVTYKDTRYLWKSIKPAFTAIMNRVYLSELFCEDNDLSLQLPFYAKYLLLASYLASNNPSKTDSRFFSKLRQPKLHKSFRKQTTEPNGQLVGPKDFSLDRMMAIFHSIVPSPVVPVAQLYTQVCTLVHLKLLSQTSKGPSMDLPRYKCLMDFSLAKQMAREVGFNLIHHLHNF